MKSICSSTATTALLALFVAAPIHAQSHYVSPPGYITGVVQGEKGPEAGVWVIAETKDFQTPMVKIVVTNDAGKFVLPELPVANYKVWVRGYGLADSTPIEMKPATTAVTLKVASAKTPQEAAKVYPGDYWLSMLAPPAKDLFPGTGASGNGLGLGMTDQDHWINSLKSGCNFCHQLGNALTRDVNHVFAAKPELKTHIEAWEWRLGVGVRGTNMYSLLGQMGKDPTLKALSDWTERIAARRSASGSAAAVRNRAQHRGHPMGRGRRPFLHARSDFHRQTSPECECRRAELRRERGPWPTGGVGSGGQQHILPGHPGARTQGQGSFALPVAEPPLHVLGQ